MTTNTGMLTAEQLAELVQADEIDTVIVAFPDLYGRLMGKRCDADFFLDQTVEQGTHACDYLLTVDMEMEPVPGYRFANWERGYGDFHLTPDMKTLRIADWLEKTALVICDVADSQSHQPVPVAPRSLLKQQLHKLDAAGYAAFGASELEYYLFDESYRDAAKSQCANLTPAGWYLEDYNTLQATRNESYHGALRRHLKRSGIPVETTKGEWGLGQHELNVRYADVLEMADRHAVFKQCAKEVADAANISVTFMAKFHSDRAGSSCHVHLSLWQNGKNAFPGETDFCGVKCSNLFRGFLGGWLAHAPEMMVFYAPTVNSYKRFQPGSWAPTRLACSYDNRTAGFRVVGAGESLRIECRIPGADCNPYLVFAAAIASGLDGIQRQIDPAPLFDGDVYAATELPHVPRTLTDAVELFEQSAFVREALGDEVVDHYRHFFRTELSAYEHAVTDWERIRYFERI